LVQVVASVVMAETAFLQWMALRLLHMVVVQAQPHLAAGGLTVALVVAGLRQVEAVAVQPKQVWAGL